MAKRSVARGTGRKATRQPGAAKMGNAVSSMKGRRTPGDTGNVASGGGSSSRMMSGTPGGSSNRMLSGTP